VAARFDVDAATARADAQTFLDEIVQMGMIE